MKQNSGSNTGFGDFFLVSEVVAAIFIFQASNPCLNYA